jgi:RED-like protein N-terminal region
MNNSQFRNLLAESSPRPQPKGATTQSKDASATPLLGSRARSSIPMTPRSVSGYSGSNDFARQVAEHKRASLGQGQPPTKKFKSSAAPKGTKFGAGYQDRAALLRQQQEGGKKNGNGERSQDDKEERIKALEDLVKLQQIDQATFEKLRDELGVGGDLGSTHLVKGLDWRLLEKVRRGEDVTTREQPSATEKNEVDGGKDVDEELENVLEKEVQAAKRGEIVKKGEMAPPSSLPISGEKLSRNEILKRLKASRAAAAGEVAEMKPAEPSLGSKFRRFGSGDQSEKKKFVETVNGRRREVLVITNPDGRTKRKSRWLDKNDCKPDAQGTSAAGEALGMEVPIEIAAKQKAMLEKQKLQEQEDDDIFAGVGADYNPLGPISDESDDDTNSETNVEATQGETRARRVQSGGKPRNYFSSIAIDEENARSETAPVGDPTILAALKRAAAIRKAQEESGAGDEGAQTDTRPRSKEFLERLRKQEREDAADLDLGFGESRFGDEDDEDDEAGPIWNGEEDGKKSERKRGPKKRKDNKDEVSDVMAVLERGKR